MTSTFSRFPETLRKAAHCGLGLLLLGFVFQWEIQQTGAWVEMIRDYSRDSGLQVAVADTFSGEKPCGKCLTLAREQTDSGEESGFNRSPSPSLDLEIPVMSSLSTPHVRPSGFTGSCKLRFEYFSVRPPVPPPRFFSS